MVLPYDVDAFIRFIIRLLFSQTANSKRQGRMGQGLNQPLGMQARGRVKRWIVFIDETYVYILIRIHGSRSFGKSPDTSFLSK